MQHFLFILLFIMPFWVGQRVAFVNFFLESGTGRGTVAFQQTGQKGMVSFEYLDAGTYYLLVEFPQQRGKWIEEKPRHSSMTKAAYDEKNNTYYYQGSEGYFSIRFSGLRKQNKEKFNPVFREKQHEEERTIEILNLQVKRNGGQIKMKVKKLTARQYQRKAEKATERLSSLSIRGIK